MELFLVIVIIISFLLILIYTVNSFSVSHYVPDKIDDKVAENIFKNICASFCTEHKVQLDDLTISHDIVSRNVVCSTIVLEDIVMRVYFYTSGKKIKMTYKNFTYFQYYGERVFKKKNDVFDFNEMERQIHEWSEEFLGPIEEQKLIDNIIIAGNQYNEKHLKFDGPEYLFTIWEDLLHAALSSGKKEDYRQLMCLTIYIQNTYTKEFDTYLKSLD